MSAVPDREPLSALLAALRAAARAEPATATALPAGCFTDPAFFAREQEYLFAREWLPLAHVSQLARAGAFVTVDVLQEPLILLRGRDEHIRALSRVCQHRGVDIVPSGTAPAGGCGSLSALRCPYHLWTYDLTGQLVAAPEMAGVARHDNARVRLREFRCEVADGFVFVNFDDAARPLAETTAWLTRRYLDKYGLGDAQLVWQRHWDCDFNWKVLLENFMEPYHHLGAHRATLQPLMPARNCRMERDDNPDAFAVRLPLAPEIRARLASSGRPEPGFVPFPGLGAEDHLDWWVTLTFPTHLLFLAPDRAYWYRLLPTGPETCSLLTTLLVAPGAQTAPDYAARLAQAEQETLAFHLEDMAVCGAMQRGFRARGYTRGNLSLLEEPLLHIQRYLARRLAA
jgi:phenylpropionate dioxygenase-like ring-hydroxylating dioxygenase large terminal subunit